MTEHYQKTLQKQRDEARARAKQAEAERDRLKAHILDIDAHATPYGDLPSDPGYVGTYLLTAGALHRALGTVGHSSPSCTAEADLVNAEQHIEQGNEETNRAYGRLRRAEGRLAEAEARLAAVRALAAELDGPVAERLRAVLDAQPEQPVVPCAGRPGFCRPCRTMHPPTGAPQPEQPASAPTCCICGTDKPGGRAFYENYEDHLFCWPCADDNRPSCPLGERCAGVKCPSLAEHGPRHTADTQAGPADGRHDYLSTACHHGDHAYCQADTGAAGSKTPAQCKFCAAPCRCACHGPS